MSEETWDGGNIADRKKEEEGGLKCQRILHLLLAQHVDCNRLRILQKALDKVSREMPIL